MSWFVNSLANSLKLDLHDDDNEDDTTITNDEDQHHNTTPPIDSPTPSDQTTPRRGGVKDDLSEFSKTFTKQLWGVAAFLAPPPPPVPETDISAAEGDDPPRIAGIRNDLSEIGGKFKSEISKIASSIMQFSVDEDLSIEDYADRGVVGLTNEVVAFATDVSMHPETWLDFPLPVDDDSDNDDDFELSDAQQEHALAVERLAPELAALRTELCLGYMTEGSFWKIYFVLVHPRLDRHDAVILSTPPWLGSNEARSKGEKKENDGGDYQEIMKARAMLTQELQNRKTRKPDSRTGNVELAHEEQLSAPGVDQSECVPVEIVSAEDPVIEKAVITEVPVVEKSIPTTSKSIVSVDEKHDDEEEEDADEWLKEETEATSFKGESSYPLGSHGVDDEDVSFSDLEEDDDGPASYKTGISKNPSGSNEVSRPTPKNKESNDWLDIEDIDDEA
ncbi:hypothetical protein KSS87_013210 [Heliosperma pusillum]|nr:hypothetical protein KSS87_013210 [Heliosperma pusillum]